DNLLMNTFLQIIAMMLAGFSALMSLMVIIRLPQPASPIWWAVKVYACALASYFAIASALSVVLSIMIGSLPIGLLGTYSTLVYVVYLYRVTASISPSGFME